MKGAKKWLGWGVFGLFIAFMLLMFLGPASLLVHIRPKHWSCERASFIFEGEQPVAVLEVTSQGGYRSPDIRAVHTFALDNLEILASHYQYYHLKVLGITEDHIWIVNGSKETVALSLTTMEEVYNATELLEGHEELKDIIETIEVDGTGDNLRIIALNGYQYRYSPGNDRLQRLQLNPEVREPSYRTWGRLTFGGTLHLPQSVEGELLLEAKPLFDARLQQLISTSAGDYVVYYKSLHGETGKFQLACINADERFIWKRSEAELLPEPMEYGRTFVAAALRDGVLYVVLQDFRGDESVYIVALHVENGTVLWQAEI